MMSKAAVLAGILASLMTAALQAQQATNSAATNAPPADESAANGMQDVAPTGPASAAADADQSKPDATKNGTWTTDEALLAAKAAGYKLVNRNGKEVVCKKETVTGSRIATRTICLTLAQWEEMRNSQKKTIDDLTIQALSVNPKVE
jgi:hypothetical protein